RRGSGSD
ncbi:hypothetical protein QN277_017888, partial [Acacia crassicarpa]